MSFMSKNDHGIACTYWTYVHPVITYKLGSILRRRLFIKKHSVHFGFDLMRNIS